MSEFVGVIYLVILLAWIYKVFFTDFETYKILSNIINANLNT